MIYSPLRYPGGKNKLSAFIAKLCLDNEIDGHYVEPYSGGASVALFLLLEGYVRQVTINDKDRSIFAFWYSVLHKTDQLCELILETEVSIDEWRRQRAVQANKSGSDLLDLGFSTFFLNRTNRSGILTGGVIGGVDQRGKYLMDCRYNKTELIRRIQDIAKRKNDIRLFDYDAIDLVEIVQNEATDENIIFYFDPPYYNKASTLYMNHYKEETHQEVSEAIRSIQNIKWIVSYDNVAEIRKLYNGCPKKEYSFKHTAYNIRIGKEILFFSPNLRRPKMRNWNPLFFRKKENNIIYSPK